LERRLLGVTEQKGCNADSSAASGALFLKLSGEAGRVRALVEDAHNSLAAIERALP
jgi:hypothetical protein